MTLKNKVEILVGQRNNESISGILIKNTTGLIIEGHTIITNRFSSTATLETVAKDYAQRMISQGYSDYSLVNGERIRFSNYERIKSKRMPVNYVEIFQKELDKELQKNYMRK